MIQETRVICKACATGNDKHPHSGDTRTCINGRSEYIRNLPANQQVTQLMIQERIPVSMGKFITDLAKERKKTPWEIIVEEGLNLL